MSNLKIFENPEFGKVRVINQNGEPWFVAKDISDILGFRDASNMTRMLDTDEKGTHKVSTPGGPQHMLVVNESGLYSCILRSNKPNAKKFRKWVTSEVLPDIRKHGLYMTDNLLEKTLQDPDFMIDLLRRYKKERQEKLAYKRQTELLVHAKKLYTTTEIAKELGFRSAQELNKDLERRRIQYKINNTWVLYSDYADKGYTSIKEQVLDNGKVIYDRKWTGLGRQFLLNLYDRAEEIA